MKKKLIYFSIFLSLFFALYSFIWLLLTYSISRHINHEYANKPIDASAIFQKKHFIQFAKITPSGFPFKLAFKITGWTEENKTSRITLSSPIFLGYDILGQSLFLSHKGDAISNFKPIESGFGAKFSENSITRLKMPISMKLFKVIYNSADLFELVNFIDYLEFNSIDAKIYDLVNEQLIYSEDKTRLLFSYDKEKYYSNLQDFLSNTPNNWNIEYDLKILESSMMGRNLQSGLILNRLVVPFPMYFTTKIHIKSGAKDLHRNLEFNSKNFIDTNFSTIVADLYYKNGVENDISVKVDSEIYIKEDFSAKLWESMRYLDLLKQTKFANSALLTELGYIRDNPEKFSLKGLEKEKYQLIIDLTMLSNNKHNPTAKSVESNDGTVEQSTKLTPNYNRFIVRDISIFSQNHTGFRISNKTDLSENPWKVTENASSKGDLLIHNYDKFISSLAQYFYNLGRFKMYSDQSREVHMQGLKYFLKAISDHPNSDALDLSFNYDLSANGLKSGKIGKIDKLENLQPLYCLSLFKAASAKLEKDSSVMEQIEKLVPDCKQYQGLFQGIVRSPG